MAKVEEIQVGKLFRHKGGKLYMVCGEYRNPGTPRWGRQYKIAERGPNGEYLIDTTRVDCVQWQINEKYPNGREYQAARELKIADLTAV